MSTKENREFSAQSVALAGLAQGVTQHSKEPDFPARLKTAGILDIRTRLEASRQAYTQFQAQADQAYDAFSAVLKESETCLSNAQRLLQGFYGFRSPTLADFGFEPPKARARKAPRNGNGTAVAKD